MDYVLAAGRRQRKRQAIHQRILDVSDQLFRERGVAGTTVDDIAEAADVARQTFFNHFPYKEACAVELAADGIESVAQKAHCLLEFGLPALDVLCRTAEAVLEAALQDGERAAVVARELLHPDPERAQRAAQQVPLYEVIEAILVQAREEGSVRSDLPLDVVASRICGVVRGMSAQILSSDPAQLRLELAVSFDMVINGIAERRIS
ncbi:MAG TPA: helix-turn-helix domain-containing protein [Chloroflexota bacterium]